MPVSLSIKAVPDALVDGLRRRAAGNHRSLQRELMAIVEAAVHPVRHAAQARCAMSASPPPALRVAESEPVRQMLPSSAEDGLLEELDSIVAGSRWGEAPLLTRDQLHDRALAREVDFDARQADRAQAVKQQTGRES